MQHVLKCWERQSDDTEYKKTLQRTGLRPGPRRGELTALPQAHYLVGMGWLPLPKNPVPRSRPFGPRLCYPTLKLVPTPLSTVMWDGIVATCTYSEISTRGPVAGLDLSLLASTYWPRLTSLVFLPRDAMRKSRLCGRPVYVRLSVRRSVTFWWIV